MTMLKTDRDALRGRPGQTGAHSSSEHAAAVKPGVNQDCRADNAEQAGPNAFFANLLTK